MSPLPAILSILCLFQGETFELNALGTAFSLARRFGAIVRVLHISTPPMNIIDPFGAGAYAGAIASTSLMDRLVQDDDNLIVAARQHVLTSASLYGLPLRANERELTLTAGPGVLFIVQENYASHLLELYGHMSDLIVAAGQDIESLTDESRILTALFGTGKGLILVPSKPQMSVENTFRIERVAIGWDASVQASRALTKALPLLADVKHLYLFKVCEHGHMPHPGMVDAEAVLRDYGIKPVSIELDEAQKSVGESLVTAAADMKVDLLVMGAYGHNRLTERLLGGTSRYVMKHAALPVLLTH